MKTNEIPQPESDGPSHLVAIGASAGGLEAIESFFNSIPNETGMAFVVVQHLSPDFKSLMNEILVRFTGMEVFRVEEKMNLKRNAVYLIPPGKQMVITNEGFHLTERSSSATPEQTISVFFESVAKVWKDKGIGVVLSGSGSDGSRGIAEISEAGGLAIVQNPEEAKFDAMPRAALNTGRIDLVREAGNMVEAILLFEKDPDGARTLDTKQAPEEAESDIERIIELLNESFGTDFSVYKPGTVNRRIERRTSIFHQMRLTDYRKLLEEDKEELNLLYKDLLIGVTHFFRDKDSFEVLAEQAIPGLFDRLNVSEELRVWVAGCATGEEVYTLAILLDEHKKKINSSKKWKIFATDIHPGSLEKASAGEYSAAQVSDVSQERLDRYFTKAGEKYRISRALRDDVVFASHNVLKDPPFTRIHLVTCRNLLIYFEQEAQERVLGVFSFALRMRGTLFLGGSESLGNLNDDFETVDRKARLFTKVRETRISASGEPFRVKTQPRRRRADLRSGEEPTFTTMERLLESHLESGVLLNQTNEMIYSIGETREFLRPPSGRMSNQFLEMLPDSITMTVSGAIHQARRKGTRANYTIDCVLHGESSSVVITTVPIEVDQPGDDFVFITLEKVRKDPDQQKSSKNSNEGFSDLEIDEFSSKRISELENELRISQEGIQNVVEELETSNEELQSTNEELVASNEELQSTNEELQSVNEELYTVNAEFDSKNRELADLNGDLDNLLKSTQIGVVFLDKDLRIRKFTPSAARAIYLLDSDILRPLSHITNNLRLSSDELLEMAEGVVASEEQTEREVQSRNGTWFLMRILPFTNSDHKSDGVVLAFIDIDQVKRTQAEREMDAQRLRVIMESVDSMGWLHLDSAGNCIESQQSWENFLGQKWPDYRDFGWMESFHDDDRTPAKSEIEEKIKDGSKFSLNAFRVRRATTSSFLTCEFSFWPVRTGAEITGWVVCVSDLE